MIYKESSEKYKTAQKVINIPDWMKEQSIQLYVDRSIHQYSVRYYQWRLQTVPINQEVISKLIQTHEKHLEAIHELILKHSNKVKAIEKSLTLTRIQTFVTSVSSQNKMG